MITALDAPPDLLDAEETLFVAKIREHGWHGTLVGAGDGEPQFAYSSGFWLRTGQPEMMIFGLRPTVAQSALWAAYRAIGGGHRFVSGTRTDELFEGMSAYVFTVARRFYPTYLGWSRFFYGNDDFPCQQIVWADRAGLFPWEAGYDRSFELSQIDLTERGWVASLS